MLKHRCLTGFAAAFIIIPALFLLPAWAHLLVIFGIFALAQMEFGDMIKRSGHKYEFAATSICGTAYLAISAVESPVFSGLYPWPPPFGLFNTSSVVLVLTPAVLLACGVFRRNTKNAMETFALSFAGFWYVAVLLAFVIRISFEWETYPGDATNYTGRLALLLFVVLVKFGDIGAYFIGMKFGRRKLIPEISPKKSVEGLFGAYAASILMSLIFWAIGLKYGGHLCQMRYPLVHALILPIILTTAGVLGDLSESLIKRSVDVKDSGTRFPGMGGALDILDSLLYSAPLAFLYITAFLK
jgi:CDP-diglyceride synthetase